MKSIYSLSAILLIASSFSLHAMLFKNLSDPLNDIQKQLVARTIQKRGLDSVLQEIEKTASPQLIPGDWGDEERYSIALEIKDIFHKNEVATDSLAHDIFGAIAENEKDDGYIPSSIEKEMFGALMIKMPNNSLGSNTRYYWLEKDGKLCTDAVRVEAHLINKVTLLELINNYKN